jgi:aminoglycoside phosphotransferase family enzyme/predicted kinase
MNSSTVSEQSSLLIKALQNPRAYPDRVGLVALIETHISWIVLTGQYAYKLKKPVDFGFLDFSTLEKRKFYCEEEIRLNRRLAESLYLEVVPITGQVTQPRVNGSGPIIEYAVKMRQFESGQLLSERAEQGLLSISEIDQIADIMSRFHQSAEVADAASPYGKAEDIRHWAEENFEHIAPLVQGDEDLRLREIEQWSCNEWEQKADMMRERKRLGFVRECHGDLHLGNMTLIDGRVTPFDCIEFNPKLRWIDVISELAFIVMDLAHRELEPYGYRLLNGYLQQTGDYQGLALLRYYLVYRAMVRAKVALLRLNQTADEAEQHKIRSEYAAYVSLAERYTQPPQPRMMITHGFSGSGKSFFARPLAESLGAIQLRSDIERKRLYGFEANEATGSGAGTGIYTFEAGRKTFQHLAELAKAVLRAGFSVIVDATFIRAELRDQFHQIAQSCDAPFLILDFHASEQELHRRIAWRQQQGNDPSEATVEVLRQQMLSDEPLTTEERERAVTVDTENESALALLVEALR